FSRRMWIGSFGATDTPYAITLFAILIALIKDEAISRIFHCISVLVHFELVHAFRVIARGRDRTKNGVANIDHKDRASFATKKIKVGNVEANILPRDG